MGELRKVEKRNEKKKKKWRWNGEEEGREKKEEA